MLEAVLRQQQTPRDDDVEEIDAVEKFGQPLETETDLERVDRSLTKVRGKQWFRVL